MKITSPCVVGLTWTLKDTFGVVLDELDESVEFLIGGQDLLAKIEEHLAGHTAGDKLEFQLEPAEAFGDYDESLVFLEQRVIFPAELEEGMTYDGAALPAGANTNTPTDNIYTVTELYPEHVVLDGNHPLAGIALRLYLNVVSVRAVTTAELAKGSMGTGFFKLDAMDLPPPGSALH